MPAAGHASPAPPQFRNMRVPVSSGDNMGDNNLGRGATPEGAPQR